MFVGWSCPLRRATSNRSEGGPGMRDRPRAWGASEGQDFLGGLTTTWPSSRGRAVTFRAT